MIIRKEAFVSLLITVGALEACQSNATDDGGAPLAGASSSGSDAGAAQAGSAGAKHTGGMGSGRGGAGAAGADGDGAGDGGAALGGAGAGGTAATDGGAAGSSGEGGDSSSPEQLFAYVSTVLGDLLLCSVEPGDGTATLLPSSPLDSPGFLHGVAVDVTGRFLFALAEPSRIDTYPIAADGSLPAEPSSSAVVDDDNPLMSLTLDPLGRFAYVASPFSRTIYSFAVDPATGAFAPVAEPLLVGPGPDHRSPAYVAADPSGHFLYVSQMIDPAAPADDNGIRGYRVDQGTGVLTELAASPFGDGNVIAGALKFRPDGKFLFSSGGGLNVFSIDAEGGNLELVAGSPFTEDVGSDPWASNLAVDPRGDFVYVSHFLPTQHLSGFAIDPETGKLEEVPGSPVTTSAPYSIAIEPTGSFLLVGDDTGQLPVFAISRADGALTAVAGSPFPFGGLEPAFAFVTRP